MATLVREASDFAPPLDGEEPLALERAPTFVDGNT
jgi:hypothetical protein